MATANPPNPRASLLAGLRTGGVRSSSNPISNVPHTAAPGGSFSIPRLQLQRQYSPVEEDDELSDMISQSLYLNPANHANKRQAPMTAAVDGPNNRFSQHQQSQLSVNNGGMPMSPFGLQGMQSQAQAQALHMQMMQMELIRLQAIQAQQYQAELLAQAQRQQQLQRRASFNPPATAGPTNISFDLRSAAQNAQLRRANQAEHLKAYSGNDDQMPMTAALGGKFGGRVNSMGASRYGNEDDDLRLNVPTSATPATATGRTTVISGGTSLGHLTSNIVTVEGGNAAAPSKSDTASTWRRGGNNNSVLSGNRTASLPAVSVKITPPSSAERVSPPPAQTPAKSRPQPLQFNLAVQQSLPAVMIDTTEATDGAEDDASSTTSSRSGGAGSPRSTSPFTPPHSSSSNGSHPPLSPREEASKKLYEGLGIGRPAPQAPVQGAGVTPQMTVASHRLASQAVRQPRGPPSGADELGPKNFATRIRRKAIGGLGMLMGARERREVVEAY